MSGAVAGADRRGDAELLPGPDPGHGGQGDRTEAEHPRQGVRDPGAGAHEADPGARGAAREDRGGGDALGADAEAARGAGEHPVGTEQDHVGGADRSGPEQAAEGGELRNELRVMCVLEPEARGVQAADRVAFAGLLLDDEGLRVQRVRGADRPEPGAAQRGAVPPEQAGATAPGHVRAGLVGVRVLTGAAAAEVPE